MRLSCVAVSGACLLQHACGYATPVGSGSRPQMPLEHLTGTTPQSRTSQQLHGRFLHITDLHPDPFYKVHSSPSQACHHGKGAAGIYGAENTDCDTPISLINTTLQWIGENLKDDIDFVIWTGDSARHDSDEKIPRDTDQVLSSNRWLANRFRDVFRRDGDDPHIPIVPTLGNNDILPHNILTAGPNKWLNAYADIWGKFIPEEQRHGFERGGWFYVEVIPNRLAVFSLNTLYFFEQNAAVDGCDSRSQPGYEHMEWLRIQLQFMRERGMKAILMGHVPPARTESKQVWDETCWQKYTLWLQQYRDVVVGGIYGHMNIDHFMLQDTKEVDLLSEARSTTSGVIRTAMEDELTIESMNSYLKDLRDGWSDLPDLTNDTEEATNSKGKKGKKRKKDKALKKIGGLWGERYQVTHVSPSVVPNFFPTLRIVHYNITGLDTKTAWPNAPSVLEPSEQIHLLGGESGQFMGHLEDDGEYSERVARDVEESSGKKKKKKPKHPDLIVPSPPSKKSPPGPAYSPQTLTLLGYTQYFANLTVINNEFEELEGLTGDAEGKSSKDKLPKPKPFEFEVEYDTFTDPVYKLKDMTVRSYIKLAHRIGQYKLLEEDRIDGLSLEDSEHAKDVADNGDLELHSKKGKKHRKQREKNKAWLEFVRRAYVGALSDEELQSFEQSSEPASSAGNDAGEVAEAHDGEL